MSTEHPEGGQPAGQLSPDGHWRWDGHNWVPAHQVQGAGGQPAQQSAAPPYAQQQPQYGQPGAQQGAPPPYAQQQQSYPQPYPQAQYGGGMPPPTKKGLPTWAKILLTVLLLVVGLIALLTVVGLTMSEDYADMSCEDVATEALSIDENKEEAFALTDVTDLEIVEDNREDFSPPADGRGVVLSCEGTGEWTDLGEAPVLVVLEAGEDGEEWVRYEMAE